MPPTRPGFGAAPQRRRLGAPGDQDPTAGGANPFAANPSGAPAMGGPPLPATAAQPAQPVRPSLTPALGLATGADQEALQIPGSLMDAAETPGPQPPLVDVNEDPGPGTRPPLVDVADSPGPLPAPSPLSQESPMDENGRAIDPGTGQPQDGQTRRVLGDLPLPGLAPVGPGVGDGQDAPLAGSDGNLGPAGSANGLTRPVRTTPEQDETGIGDSGPNSNVPIQRQTAALARSVDPFGLDDEGGGQEALQGILELLRRQRGTGTGGA